MYKEILKDLLIKEAKENATKAMPKPKRSQGWDEGESIEIEGLDKQLRKKFDDKKEGNRWTPEGKNKLVKMKIRGK
mgnify:CR=1 FL=1